MLPAKILAVLFASGQAALALPTVAHSHAGVSHINAHKRVARSVANKPVRRACSSGNATDTDNEEVAPEDLQVAGGGAIATSDNGNKIASGGLGKSMRILFPTATTKVSSLSWSTNKQAPNSIALSDSALGATDIMNLPHDVKNAPDGSKAMEVSFKKGSYNFNSPRGGFSFVASGPSNVPLSSAKEATFAYSIFFQEGFQFNIGGKLPGLIGGQSFGNAKGCNGGNKATNCFSARMMWRSGGRGELYAYLPPGLKGNSGVCNIKPESHCNPSYGSSVGRGAFTWGTGKWTTMAQRVRLNDPGQANGEIEVFVGGESVIKATGITLRRNGSGRIRAAHIQSFFGGHNKTWASPRDQKFWIKDFSLAITEQL